MEVAPITNSRSAVKGRQQGSTRRRALDCQHFLRRISAPLSIVHLITFEFLLLCPRTGQHAFIMLRQALLMQLDDEESRRIYR